MEVKYKVNQNNDLLTIKLYTINNSSINSQITVVQTITKKDFIKAGNLIDRATMPFKICYIVLKQFHEKISQMMLQSLEYVYDEEVKDKIIEYSKKILSDKIEIVPEETFRNMLKEVEEFSENI